MTLGRHGRGGWRPWAHRWGSGWRGRGWGGGPWSWPDPIYVVAEPTYPTYALAPRLVPRERTEIVVCAGATNIGKGVDRCGDGSIIYDRTLYEERGGKLVRRSGMRMNGLFGLEF